jgi:hypothetical protein
LTERSENWVELPSLPEDFPNREETARRRDAAVAATALRMKITLQEAADVVGRMMQAADEAVKLQLHGPGPTVPGPSYDRPIR